MGLFGASFDEKVKHALDEIRSLRLGVTDLDATIDGKVVTLTGSVPDMATKSRVMHEFNRRVETANTINRLRVIEPAAAKPAEAPQAAPPAAEETVHVVVAGDTLSGLAKKYYGKGSLYMKIFEANRDQLSDPNLIKVGQRLRIPKP